MNHTNHLINETSPYLLPHAHNPVNWYPWGEEALKVAKTEDKPILVSIGYSACHWCHVMEKESFENEATASLMNENFINIKIDREERPDLDHIYMDAVQAMVGNGGWPLNVFLTPGCKPFYGGTYFPPVKAYNRASWPEVLLGVSRLFKEKREEVEEKAEELTRYLASTNGIAQTKNDFPLEEPQLFTREQADSIFENIMKQADTKWGGFGKAPKFPQTFTIQYLLQYAHFTKNAEALQQGLLSLDKMIQGGIYDQLGGGFARYSTDAEWLAPHFEKMLYDNALILSAMCDAFQLTGNMHYKTVITDTIDFVERELMDAAGGFYAALDADSEGVEGRFYVWDYTEVMSILGSNGPLFCEFFDITPGGNWEHTNILRTLVPLNEFAGKKNIAVDDLEKVLGDGKEMLFKARSKRPRPLTDDKIILGWNALMIISLCKSYSALGSDQFRQMAIQNFNFLWSSFRKGDTFQFFHTYKNGVAKYPAFLDDYAYLISACIYLQEITSEEVYIKKGESILQYVIAQFSDETEGFFYTSKLQQDVIVRKKEWYDGAVPSANAFMAWNLYYFSVLLGNTEWGQKAVGMVRYLSDLSGKYPTSFGNWACMMLNLYQGFNEIAITGKDFSRLRDELLGHFIPNKVLQCSENGNGNEYPLLSNKPASGEPLVYLCRNYTCLEPVKTIPGLLEKITDGFK
jgi:uncharacterized protein YyaL (SSP411 family)